MYSTNKLFYILRECSLSVSNYTRCGVRVLLPYTIFAFRTSDHLEEILHNCDYICNILPSTPNTRGMLDGDMFRHCEGRRSVFINVGRGDICSEESILKALG